MGDLPTYYQSIHEKSDYEDILNERVHSLTPPPIYKRYDGSISNPTLISGPSHLTSISVAFDKSLSSPPQNEKSESLSDKIKCYIRIVEVFSSIAKEDMYCVPIIHVKKEEKNTGLRALFFNKRYQLQTLEVFYHNPIAPGVYLASDPTTMEKAVIHLAATSIYASNDTTTITTELSPFGFTFFWNNKSATKKITKGQREYDVSHLTEVPDEQIQAALFIWCKHREQMPCLSLATHIYREGVDIYAVFDRHYF
ncbi:hypothetical protein K501DRAFT_286018 [Backusella circina FSU 941]|nr:hypothetical protein K501DRAFT_286018 [Backusella circina FSU 941]